VEAAMTERALDPVDWQAFRAEAHRAVDALVDHISSPREQAGWRPVPPTVASRLRAPFSPEGVGLPDALDAAIRDVLAYPTGNAHPRFWGWVMGSGAPTAIVGDLLAAGLNANNFGSDQAAAHVELAVIDWVRQLVGFPDDATGLMVSGGSMANLAGLAVARNERGGPGVREEGLSGHTARLMVYASVETHGSVRKALELMGLGERSLSKIAVDEHKRIDLEALRAAIARDRSQGRRPIAVVGNAGTVNTGAVDDLTALADLAAAERLWFHVDGAIGVPMLLTERGRALLAGIARADSIALDLHKWLYMPYECGMVLVRPGGAQRRAFATSAPYLAVLGGGTADGPFAFNDHGVQLSRSLKALKVWLALRAHGTAPFAAAIEANLDQAQHLAARVAAEPTLELMAPVATNVVCFRFRAPALGDAGEDALNQRLLVLLQTRGHAVPSGTTVDGRAGIRCAITNHRTTLADLDALVAATLAVGAELTAEAAA
jgi:glutamate/tyrosine decarboxylase-like PLP-dependent enzyme